MLRQIEREQRAATDDERAALALWSGWGALPAVFDPAAASYAQFAAERESLQRLLSAEQLAAAKRSTLNAHYTDRAYVRAIWAAVESLGFGGGRVLEPGCGHGNFIAEAPERAQLSGVELDPTTAAIAAALHPRAAIHCESFADSRFAESTFDLVVGNVPFGDYKLRDRKHNPAGHSIHNHFILKSVQLVKPGGLVAVITSRYTLDSRNPAARREMAEHADLLGAVRLPSGAHRLAAGTDVVTDLLVFRRREPGREPAGASFERSRELRGLGDGLSVNEYFADHPDHVLGSLRATQGEGGRAELEVVGDRNAAPQLEAALGQIAEIGLRDGLSHAAGEVDGAQEPVVAVAPAAGRAEGYLATLPDGTFTRVEAGGEVRYVPPASQARELRALIELRDTVVMLLEAEAASIDDDAELEATRRRLNTQYAAYVERFGPLNRFSERPTGHIDAETGERKLARIRPRQGGFRTDPFANVVYALEHFDSSTQTASKATIFHERVLVRRPQRLGADTAEDALAICLDHFGQVQLDAVARLLGVDELQAREALGTLVFDEPGSERLVTAAEYLSGNVRSKLKAAEAAMADDLRYAPNVAALAAVQPRDLAPDEIAVQLGAAWIERRYVEQFLRETLEDPSLTVDHPGGSVWVVESENAGSIQATSQWGTEHCPAPQLAQSLLEQRAIRIYDTRSDGEKTFNAEATDEAMAKATELSDRFAEWVWQDPERAELLARTYNERFNALVPRSYDGAALSLPGLAITFKPRPHQLAAVARIIQEPTVGLFHEVGAGKTAEMVMGAMELKRLGLANKPAIVVPNHMLEQFTREWLQMYPQARILAASSEDLTRDNRRLFQARCATGDWDGIVMTRSAFERLPMSLAAQKRYLDGELAELDAMLVQAEGASSRFTLKRVEKLKAKLEARIEEKLDAAKDPGLSFEMTGIDYLFADEAQGYKNARTKSNIEGMAVDGSMRAEDLHMKIEFLRSRRARCVTLATATPIANSMGEVYTMQRYLRPDLLHQAGITDFDQWAATFGKTITAIEVGADGSGLRMKTRFASFRNVPELLQLWQVSADIKTAEDLQLPVPALRARESDGARAPETVVLQPSEPLRQFVELLAERAERVRGRGIDPKKDNMLKIASDGRAAGLDLRLVGLETAEEQKVEIAAARIASIYRAHRDDVFPGIDGLPHARPGALQLVFSDLGTPKDDAWNVYDALRAQLVEHGVPRGSIRFIHEARDDREKGELFAACRDGRVAVLCGSTERMGVGTNVQLRAVALHHLDCPWRPADLAQREGRILRQGNANAEVRILRYVTEGSFDAYLWQTVARKSTFIAQVMRGRLDVREIEDIGDAALSYQEVKALAAGNPLLLDHARVLAEVTRLERLERAHMNRQQNLRWSLQRSEELIARRRNDAVQLEQAIARLAAVRGDGGDGFSMTVRGKPCSRTEGNKALRMAILEYAVHASRSLKQGRVHPPAIVGDVFGFEIRLAPAMLTTTIVCDLPHVPRTGSALAAEELQGCLPLTRIDKRLAELPTELRSAQWEIHRQESEVQRSSAEIGKPFRQAELLDKARAELRELDAQLQAQLAPPVPSLAPSTASTELERAPSATPELGQEVAEHDSQGPNTVCADPETRWQAALAREEGAIAARAQALSVRLEARATELSQKLQAQQAAPPNRFLGLGGKTYRQWEAELGLREARRAELLACAARTREYLATASSGLHQSKCRELAVRRVSRAAPALMEEVLDHRREQARRTPERAPRSRGRGT